MLTGSECDENSAGAAVGVETEVCAFGVVADADAVGEGAM